jgi:peptidoglycan hydrolase-like protein with peptidoglycan-binding domain
MHRPILAALAAAALFAPALAQQINMNGQSRPGQEKKQQSLPISGASRTAASLAISPQLLSSRQVRDIQQALVTRGANSIRVDGEWGPGVEAALRDFQKSENLISQNGEPDSLTLMALGLDPLGFGLSGASWTTGQAVRDGAAPRERKQDMPERQLIPGGERDR